MKSMNHQNLKSINALVSLAIIFSLLGLGDTLFLTIKHYEGTPLTCVILEGCDVVTTSSYSLLWGIPLALFGVMYYTALFGLLLIFAIYELRFILKLIAVIAVAGFLVSLYLTYIQVFVIGAICIYCVLSAVFTTLILILSILAIKRN